MGDHKFVISKLIWCWMEVRERVRTFFLVENGFFLARFEDLVAKRD